MVYSIPCANCVSVYIGQTGCPLGTHLKEHIAAIKFAKTDVFVVAEHVWVKINFKSILAQEHDQYQRCNIESLFIQQQSI